MTDGTAIWRGKSDNELLAASRSLFEYTEEGEQLIRAELSRRGLEQPPPAVAQCPRCNRSLHPNDPGDECAQCGEPFSEATLALMGRASKVEEREPVERGDLVTVATFETLIDAELAKAALESGGIDASIVPDAFFRRSPTAAVVEVKVRQRDREDAEAFLADAEHQPRDAS